MRITRDALANVGVRQCWVQVVNWTNYGGGPSAQPGRIDRRPMWLGVDEWRNSHVELKMFLHGSAAASATREQSEQIHQIRLGGPWHIQNDVMKLKVTSQRQQESLLLPIKV